MRIKSSLLRHMSGITRDGETSLCAVTAHSTAFYQHALIIWLSHPLDMPYLTTWNHWGSVKREENKISFIFWISLMH